MLGGILFRGRATLLDEPSSGGIFRHDPKLYDAATDH